MALGTVLSPPLPPVSAGGMGPSEMLPPVPGPTLEPAPPVPTLEPFDPAWAPPTVLSFPAGLQPSASVSVQPKRPETMNPSFEGRPLTPASCPDPRRTVKKGRAGYAQ